MKPEVKADIRYAAKQEVVEIKPRLPQDFAHFVREANWSDAKDLFIPMIRMSLLFVCLSVQK
jgi:hypothetical protein